MRYNELASQGTVSRKDARTMKDVKITLFENTIKYFNEVKAAERDSLNREGYKKEVHSRFCALYELIEDSGLEDEYQQWKALEGEYKDKAKEIIAEKLFDEAVALMDDNLRERIHRENAPCAEEMFLALYLKAHKEKFNEDFSVI